MGTEKRERQKQGRQARIEAARVAQQRAQRFRTMRNFGIVIVVIVGGLFALTWFTGKNNSSNVSASGDSESTGLTSTTVLASAAPITVPPPGATMTGDTPCPAADGSAPRTTMFAKEAPTCIAAGKTYTAKLDTSKGSFTMKLDAVAAPKSVNNFVVLARYHFYDGVAFHRIIPGFVVQGGDATGPKPGAGGPGYQISDELPTVGPPYYPLQSVAMANSGPNTNGSQFFIVTGPQGVALPASYSLFATVTEGFDVVKQIEAIGSSGGTPSEAVTITGVTVSEG
ncbi:MAG: peptidylprolyl isomerase [Acidimicrobiales bacterium]